MTQRCNKPFLVGHLVIHVVGNKLDLAPRMRAIPLSRTLEYVSKTLGADCEVHEVSAKDDEGRTLPVQH